MLTPVLPVNARVLFFDFLCATQMITTIDTIIKMTTTITMTAKIIVVVAIVSVEEVELVLVCKLPTV